MPNWICLLCDNDTPIPHDHCEIGPSTEPPKKHFKDKKACCFLVRLGQKRHAVGCKHHPEKDKRG